MEYWPTIPAAIIIMVAGATIASFLGNSFRTTAEYLDPGLKCEAQPEEPFEGSDQAQLGCHTIELVGRSYNEEYDRTTVAYKVTSVCSPSISHWVLGFPSSLAGKVVSSSEAYEWVVDPKTGVAGLKFDTGYGGGRRTYGGVMLVDFFRQTGDSRTVLLTLAGHFDWSMTDVAVKAGTEVYTSTITAPVTVYQEEENQCDTP
jgi:hypothetical protein